MFKGFDCIFRRRAVAIIWSKRLGTVCAIFTVILHFVGQKTVYFILVCIATSFVVNEIHVMFMIPRSKTMK